MLRGVAATLVRAEVFLTRLRLDRALEELAPADFAWDFLEEGVFFALDWLGVEEAYAAGRSGVPGREAQMNNAAI